MAAWIFFLSVSGGMHIPPSSVAGPPSQDAVIPVVSELMGQTRLPVAVWSGHTDLLLRYYCYALCLRETSGGLLKVSEWVCLSITLLTLTMRKRSYGDCVCAVVTHPLCCVVLCCILLLGAGGDKRPVRPHARRGPHATRARSELHPTAPHRQVRPQVRQAPQRFQGADSLTHTPIHPTINSPIHRIRKHPQSTHLLTQEEAVNGARQKSAILGIPAICI